MIKKPVTDRKIFRRGGVIAAGLRKWAGLVMCVLFFCVSAPAYAGEAAFPPANPQRVRTALRASVRSLGLQTQLPVSRERITAESSPLDNVLLRRGPFVSNTAGILFYGALAAIAIVIFMTWRDNLWSSSRSRRFERITEESVPAAEAAARMEKAQVEADEFARQGNFAEAMHTLLLRSVDELRRYLSVSIAVSLTSREILRHANLSSEGRDLFADIINRVEISYFGAHCPEADDYRACRSSFDSLTGVLRQYSAQSGSFFMSS